MQVRMRTTHPTKANNKYGWPRTQAVTLHEANMNLEDDIETNWDTCISISLVIFLAIIIEAVL